MIEKLKYISYQALLIFVLFLFSILFVNSYYYWIVKFIFIFCSVIFFYGLLSSLFFSNYNKKSIFDKTLSEKTYNLFFGNIFNNFNIDKHRYLSLNNLITHIIPFIILLIIIKYFVKNKTILKTKYTNEKIITILIFFFILNYFILDSSKIYKEIWGISFVNFNILCFLIMFSMLFLVYFYN